MLLPKKQTYVGPFSLSMNPARTQAQADTSRPAGREQGCFPSAAMILVSEFHQPREQQGGRMDELKNQMETVARIYQQLDEKITEHGGVQNLFGINRKIRQALETISFAELDSMLSEIHRAKEGLSRLQEDIIEIRLMKEVLSSTTRSSNGTTR
jgi:hypothetical protein